jgi:hypothetical protein
MLKINEHGNRYRLTCRTGCGKIIAESIPEMQPDL